MLQSTLWMNCSDIFFIQKSQCRKSDAANIIHAPVNMWFSAFFWKDTQMSQQFYLTGTTGTHWGLILCFVVFFLLADIPFYYINFTVAFGIPHAACLDCKNTLNWVLFSGSEYLTVLPVILEVRSWWETMEVYYSCIQLFCCQAKNNY